MQHITACTKTSVCVTCWRHIGCSRPLDVNACGPTCHMLATYHMPQAIRCKCLSNTKSRSGNAKFTVVGWAKPYIGYVEHCVGDCRVAPGPYCNVGFHLQLVHAHLHCGQINPSSAAPIPNRVKMHTDNMVPARCGPIRNCYDLP